MIAAQKKIQKIKPNIIVSDIDNFNQKILKFQKDGPEKIHVLSDFDKTLTKVFVNGKKFISIISQLRDGKYLSPDYASSAHELYNIYAPIEHNQSIPREERSAKMYQWWKTHYEILAKYGLNMNVIEEIVAERKLKFREGTKEFLSILKNNKIPVIIMSGAGIGDMIPMYLTDNGMLFDNIDVVANFLIYENGVFKGVREPIIHTMNKSEIILKKLPDIFNKIKNRKNVILLGDSIEDTGMIDGFKYENLIKIGFLNENADKDLENFKKNYDMIILNDAGFEEVNKMINQILNR